MSRSFVLTLITALILLVSGGSSVNAQFAISGTVTNPSAAPVSSVKVFLYDDQGNPIGGATATTDVAGFYAISGIPSGTYGLGFEPLKVSALLAKFVSPVIVSGNTTVNTSLIQGNFLSGFVRDSLGAPIFNIDINVYDFIPDTVITTSGDNTDITGFYQVLIPDGTFKLRWRALNGENLMTVDIPGVAITHDTVISVTMVAGAMVSGTITRTNLTPVLNANLDFINAATGLLVVTPGDNTDGSGFYQVQVAPGTYNIRVNPLFTDGLVPIEVLNVIIPGNTVRNFTLSPGFIISGTLTDSGGAPVFDADIDLKNTNTGVKMYTPNDNTNSLGQYQVLAVAGKYGVYFKPPVATRLAPVFADSITMNSATVVNAKVPHGFLVSGLVRNNNLVPVVNTDIDAAKSSTLADVFLVGDNTDAAGYYGVVLVGGTYHIDIEPPFVRRLTARHLANQVVSGDMTLNVNLDTGMVISGTVTDSAGAVVPNVDVSAIVSSSGDTIFTPLDNTGSLGTYQILVPPNVYKFVYIPVPPATLIDTVIKNSVTIAHDTTINAQFSSGQPACCVNNRGDINNDGTNSNVLDLTYLVNRIFRGGPPAACPTEADVNSDGTTSNVLDLTFLVNRIFRGGPPTGPC